MQISNWCSWVVCSVYKGDDVNVLERKWNTRSKLECATMCYSDKKCMTAVYKKNGDCLFIRNFTDTLTIEDDSQSYILTEEIMEIKTKTDTGKTSSLVILKLIKR